MKLVVTAQYTERLTGTAPDSIMYMPKGRWKITPSVNGKPKEIELDVDNFTADILQADLEQRLQDNVKPFADFDHLPGPAAFHPKSFRWDADKGVMLDVEWTAAGRDAVAGKNYGYFSPTFLLSEDKVAGLPDKGAVGALTNNPAFRQIQPIAASDNPPGDVTGNNPARDNIMKKVIEELVSLGIITASDAGNEDTVTGVVTVNVRALQASLKASQDTVTALKAENTELKTKVTATQEKEASDIIEAAINEGKIGGNDESTIAFFKAQLIAQPEATKKVLAAMPKNPLLDKIVNIKAGDQKRSTSGLDRQALIEAQTAAVKATQAKNPHLSYAEAFNQAKAEKPDLFPVEA
jgi:phage I-like protein